MLLFLIDQLRAILRTATMKFTAPAALLFLASLAIATEAPVARGEVDAPVAAPVKQDVPVKREEDFTLEKRKGSKKGGGGSSGGDEE